MGHREKFATVTKKNFVFDHAQNGGEVEVQFKQICRGDDKKKKTTCTSQNCQKKVGGDLRIQRVGQGKFWEVAQGKNKTVIFDRQSEDGNEKTGAMMKNFVGNFFFRQKCLCMGAQIGPIKEDCTINFKRRFKLFFEKTFQLFRTRTASHFCLMTLV